MNCAAILCRMESFEHQKKWFVNEPYVKAITNCNWSIFPICSYPSLSFALAHCDCLIIPGGYDVQGYYIQEEHRLECTYYPSTLDHFDFLCMDAFIKQKKGILGICRGMQLLNLYFHGGLLSHISEAHAKDHQHSLHFASHSFLHQLYEDAMIVNSYHHQVIGKLGNGLHAAAYSEEMYVEAITHKELAILGVQWHPELMENDQIFPYFFDIICCAASNENAAMSQSSTQTSAR